jgi:hypothetical protein
MLPRTILALGCWVLACGCGSAPVEPVAIPPQREPIVRAPEPTPKPVEWLERDDVNQVVEQGLGSFLQRVLVEPRFEQGNFVGWTIVRFREPAWWSGVDLKEGDVILSVNGQSVERPPQAYQVFLSLKTSESLSVTLQRGETTRELVLPIRDPEALPAPVADASAIAPE